MGIYKQLEIKTIFTKETLEQAVKGDAALRGAYLGGADLRGAYLRGADGKIKIKKATFIDGLYKYQCGSIITEDHQLYVKLGCFTRKIEDWEKDFWNNDNEFPNNNSLESSLRMLAYETCKKWIELTKESVK